MSLPLLLLVFAGAAGIVWWAGIALTNATDVLAHRLGLGQAMGGMVLLAVATNLPEIAITGAAAWRGDLGVAIGNILGGIAVQTVVLVLLDAFGARHGTPLTHRAASLALVLEGVLVVAVLVVCIMASRLPADLMVGRLAPGDVLILLLWLAGLWLVQRAGGGLPWQDSGTAPGAQRAPAGHSATTRAQQTAPAANTARAAASFALAAAATLACGVALEASGTAIATHVGMTGVLFGATVLAAATSLPEVSTGLQAVRMGDDKLAISDIFGGNAFLPVLFLLATLIAGHSALPQLQSTDIYLAGLGVLLTCIYICGLIFRPTTRWLGMGVDSCLVLVFYGVGAAGLFAIASPHGR